jgi:predicted TIM-barrel fold metal-dependent hydrolase
MCSEDSIEAVNQAKENWPMSDRIDVHTHLIPPFWAEELKSHGGDPSGWGSPEWSPEYLLRFMDHENIRMSVLSLTAPGIEGWKGDARVKMARRVNDYGADLVRKYPDQFGYFATLPLPDVQAALAELLRAYDLLGVDGVVLHSNFDGVYLADPLFDPLWAELNRRSATIFIHPTTPVGMPILPGIPGPLEDYPAETTRAALDLVLKGHTTRFGSTRIILSHGGGFLPYAATRFAELGASLSRTRSVESLTRDLQSFYFDTALVAPSGLPSLLAFAPPEQIVFGTDFPYASEKVSKTFTANLDEYHGLAPGTLDGINRAAYGLISRVNQRTAAHKIYQ